MMKITEQVVYVGVNDRTKHLFENLWPLPYGVSYNSYLIVDEKVALIDTVDAYPDDTFEGTVKQVRLEATTTNNVVTYEVVISAPNADLKLKPGLTANVTIYTQERSGVLAVANKALRFTPTKETVGKDMKIVDCKGKNKVWTLNGNTLTAHPVTIGQSDGINTEITKGLKQGDKIVTEIVVNVPEEEDAPQQSQGLISGPGPRGKKK